MSIIREFNITNVITGTSFFFIIICVSNINDGFVSVLLIAEIIVVNLFDSISFLSSNRESIKLIDSPIKSNSVCKSLNESNDIFALFNTICANLSKLSWLISVAEVSVKKSNFGVSSMFNDDEGVKKLN